eukprot:Awhi_evm1s234
MTTTQSQQGSVTHEELGYYLLELSKPHVDTASPSHETEGLLTEEEIVFHKRLAEMKTLVQKHQPQLEVAQKLLLDSGIANQVQSEGVASVGSEFLKKLPEILEKLPLKDIPCSNTATRDEFFNNCKTGDLVFWSGPEGISRAIRFCTDSAYSHLSVIIRGPIPGE